jgi:hypothetical protein
LKDADFPERRLLVESGVHGSAYSRDMWCGHRERDEAAETTRSRRSWKQVEMEQRAAMTARSSAAQRAARWRGVEARRGQRGRAEMSERESAARLVAREQDDSHRNCTQPQACVLERPATYVLMVLATCVWAEEDMPRWRRQRLSGGSTLRTRRGEAHDQTRRRYRACMEKNSVRCEGAGESFGAGSSVVRNDE